MTALEALDNLIFMLGQKYISWRGLNKRKHERAAKRGRKKLRRALKGPQAAEAFEQLYVPVWMRG